MPRDATQLDSTGVYANRFAGKREFRDAMWSVLCADFFQKYIPEDSRVLELAAGHCEFINHIRAAGKTAVDINPDTARHAAPDVKVVLSSTTDLSAIPDGSQDVVFASNFFEHRPKPDIVRTLRECHRILRCVWGGVQHVPPGKLLVLQPNIRYCGADYWMFSTMSRRWRNTPCRKCWNRPDSTCAP